MSVLGECLAPQNVDIEDARLFRSSDALVIGGGVAGSALAIWLGQAGRQVLLIERSAGPHPKVCGEFLSHEALHYLAALGIDVHALGAVGIDSVRLTGQRMIASAKLPFPACSLSRERLDEALLQRAIDVGVNVLRHRRVQSLKETSVGWTAQTDAGEMFYGKAAFLANGKHDLHGWNRPAGRHNDLVAFKMYWHLSPSQNAALARHVELVLFPGGYAGLQAVEESAANLCLLVRKQTYKRLGGSWAALLTHMKKYAGHLAGRLEGATALWDRPLSLSSIPYGYVREHACEELWRLGDQSVVIPSFAGDGMSIALHSAKLAAVTCLAGNNVETYQRRLACDVGRQVELATLLSFALVSPLARPFLEVLSRAWPSVLVQLAGSTRLRSGSWLD